MAVGQLYNLIHLTCYGINYLDNVIRYMQGHDLLASECKCTAVAAELGGKRGQLPLQLEDQQLRRNFGRKIFEFS